MQHAIRTATGPIRAKINLPGSANQTHRAILLAALGDGVSEISGIRLDQPTLLLIKALQQLGIVAQLDEKAHSCIIAGGNGKFPKKQATVWCGNSKTVLRFLLTACSASPGVYYFDGSTNLRKQLLSPLLNLLCRQGAQIIPGNSQQLPFTIIGADSFEGGDMILDSTVPNQLISSLLMISPYARTPFNFSIPELINQSYVDMTCAMMADFGVLVHRIHQGHLMVPAPQRYQSRDYTVEPDYATASYFLAAAAVTGGEVTFPLAKFSHSKQPDVKFLSVLERMGCHFVETHAGLTLKGPKELNGIEVSMRSFTDMFLALAAIAPFAKSPTRITHLGQMNASELKHFNIVKNEMTHLGIHIESDHNGIKIFPSTPKAHTVTPHHDPRVAMAFSIVGLKVPGVIINDAGCVNKHFPEFFKQWDKMIGQININA